MEFELDLAELPTTCRPGDAPRHAPSKKVFANGTELASILRKTGLPGGATGTLDIRLRPAPAGPVPIPYPNTSGLKRAEAELRRSGYPNLRLRDPDTRKIKIDGKEIALKGKSAFKTSSGNEAGTAAPGKSTVSKSKAPLFHVWTLSKR